jgi:hypothetical protein
MYLYHFTFNYQYFQGCCWFAIRTIIITCSSPELPTTRLTVATSFDALPTELDTKILEFLCNDRPALNAISKNSKYCSTVAEPIPYRDITRFQVLILRRSFCF